MRGSASFSRDRRYRYSLRRAWSEGPAVAWVLLNPSTADARTDDPTIRRCIDFSRRWGFGALEVVNLFALRSTDPSVLRHSLDPVGASNDLALRRALARSEAVVAGWGERGRLHGRAAEVRERLPEGVLALGVNAGGEPVHPLYVPGSRAPVALHGALAAQAPARSR